jgi:ribosomal protein S18 acetylase RimI-like enzyme
MQITTATSADLEQSAACLATAFADDPITEFLLQVGRGKRERLVQFFSLLMKARTALNMPVLVVRDAARICGAAMGNTTLPPPWPSDLEEEWENLETVAPGFNARAAIYDEVAEKYKPLVPHYYLGVIGTSPDMHGNGVGKQLLQSFCNLSASDRQSSGVYLETANPLNVRFYERAGFTVTGQGSLGTATLWCMFLRHGLPDDA